MTMLSPTALPDSVCGTIPPLPIMGDGDGDEHFPPLLRRYRLGLALFITAVAMIFVSFSSAYIVRRGIPTYESSTGVYSQTWEPLRLPLSLLLLNTCLLISASLTMEMARRRIVLSGRVKKVPASFWVRASLSLSIAFIVGQGFAWQSLWSAGRILRTGARTAFFYVLTGTHALHALLGVLALVWIAMHMRRWRTPSQHMGIDLAAWYLHSMTVLWVYIFCFLLFA